MKQPLAFRMRPEKLDDLIGQKHLIDKNGILRKCIQEQRLFSMILFGPPGTGKTTLATVLAKELNLPYRLFNAVTGNKKELDTIFEESRFYEGLALIIDEVHRLNKDKQDLLLPHIEKGSIILIGATTSNPYFAINPAIRSRCHLFEVKALTEEDIMEAIDRALNDPNGLNQDYTMEEEAKRIIAQRCNGDLRYAFNVLELCALAAEEYYITKEIVQTYSPNAAMSMDFDGDGHYDTLSAFQKSIRGSDVDAALYYLARLIKANDMDSIERRLLTIAYEDIGLANPAAVARTINAIESAKKIGFPEARIPLANAVIDLSLSPKSKSALNGISAAMEIVNQRDYPVPSYLRLKPVNLSEDEKYDYDNPNSWYQLQYLPDAISQNRFYYPNENSTYEKALAANLNELKKYPRTNKIKELNRKTKNK